MQVIAAAVAGHIQRFPRGEEPTLLFRFQRIGIKLIHARAAERDLRLFKARRARDRQHPAGQARLKAHAVRIRQHPCGQVHRPQPCRADKRLSQAARHQSAQKILQRALRKQRSAPEHFVALRAGQQIHPQHEPSSPARVHLRRQLHRADAGYVVLVKEHFARLGAHALAARDERYFAVRAYALEPAHRRRLHANRRDGRIARRKRMPKALQKAIAVRSRAQLRRGQPAAGEQQLRSVSAAPIRRGNAKAVPHGRYFAHLKIADQLRARLRRAQTQRVQHARRHIARGIDAPLGVRHAGHAEALKKSDRILRGKRPQRRAHIPMIALGRHIQIRQIAAAVTGREQLAPHARLLFIYCGFHARPREQARRGQPRRAAANDARAHSTMPRSRIRAPSASSVTLCSAREQAV